MEYKQKQIGRRNSDILDMPVNLRYQDINRWLRTVQALRGSNRICRTGLYKFKTFEEADQWMEAMIVASTQESQR